MSASAESQDSAFPGIRSLNFLGAYGGSGFEFTTHHGYHYEFSEHNGMRWRGPGGLVSRTAVDKAIGLGPGSADMLERFWMLGTESIREEYQKLAEKRREAGDDVDRMRRFAHEDALRQRSHGRHLALREWRGSNPVPRCEVPESIRRVRGIQRFTPDQPCHVYFLLDGEEVVYVGQTRSAWPSRVESHMAEGCKVFDAVWYVPVDRDSVDEVEQKYIRELQPRYNVRHVGGTS